MALLKQRTVKPHTILPDTALTLLPLSDRGEYRTLTGKIDELKQLVERKTQEREAFQEQLRRLSSQSMIDRLTAKFLSSSAKEEEPSLMEQINAKTEELRALGKAIEIAAQERDKIRGHLSVEIRSEVFPVWRANARTVLAGLLLVQRGNQANVALRENVEALGYYASPITPVAIAWPAWGVPEDVTSFWRFILQDYLDLGFIEPAEAEAIKAGDLTSFTA